MISHLTNTGFTDFKLVLDVSEWETLSVQVIGGGGTISLLGTNNPGDVQGSTDGSSRDATDFNAVQAINLTTGTAVTAVTGTNIYRISPIGFKYLQIGDGATATATKVLVLKSKPY